MKMSQIPEKIVKLTQNIVFLQNKYFEEDTTL